MCIGLSKVYLICSNPATKYTRHREYTNSLQEWYSDFVLRLSLHVFQPRVLNEYHSTEYPSGLCFSAILSNLVISHSVEFILHDPAIASELCLIYSHYNSAQFNMQGVFGTALCFQLPAITMRKAQSQRSCVW